MTDIVYNGQQLEAIDKAVTWYKNWQDSRGGGNWVKQVFFLAGYAGTGKTSVAKHIASLCCPLARVIYIAPTGKAASRLRQKGCDGAMTMHRFLYNMIGEDEDDEPMFVGKGCLDSNPLLVVLDECSMVGEYDIEKLKSHGVPILALGDLGQIPPVKAVMYFTEEQCDYNLTEIMRQNANSNIVRASMFIRQGGRLPPREYDDVKVYSRRPMQSDIKTHLAEDSVILCSYNSSRTRFNMLARVALGYYGSIPMVGEKLVCTFNQHSSNFMNGEQCILLDYKEMKTEELSPEEIDDGLQGQVLIAKVKSLTNLVTQDVKINLMCFTGNDEERLHYQKRNGGFDFGYALTIHKSQGSEWRRVMVMEEFLRGSPYNKLMYTAVTRAIEHLTVFRAPD